MSLLRRIGIGTALVVAIGCYHGPSLNKYRPAQEPAGIAVDLRMKKATVRGELLEVHDTALVVLTDSNRVVLVPIRSISVGDFEQRGVLIQDGKAYRLDELRYVSRFPAGMTPEIRARLLAAYGQTDVEVRQ